MPVDRKPFLRIYDEGIEPGPYLNITFRNPSNDKSLPALSLLDTGSDTVCVPARFAVILGFGLVGAKKIGINGATGPGTAYRHTAEIEFSGISMTVPVDFVPGLLYPLMGIEGFLSDFILTVNYPEQWFSLKLPVSN